MKILSFIARILFGLPFLVFGFFHLTGANHMIGMIPSYMVGGVFWIYLTGLGMTAAAISFFVNKLTFLSGILLAAMLLIFILTIHIPTLTDPQKGTLAMMALLKDTGLMAGALMIAASSKNS